MLRFDQIFWPHASPLHFFIEDSLLFCFYLAPQKFAWSKICKWLYLLLFFVKDGSGIVIGSIGWFLPWIKEEGSTLLLSTFYISSSQCHTKKKKILSNFITFKQARRQVLSHGPVSRKLLYLSDIHHTSVSTWSSPYFSILRSHLIQWKIWKWGAYLP